MDKGRTPFLSQKELLDIGYKIAIFPVTALLASVQAVSELYTTLKAQGSSKNAKTPLYDFTELTQLMGFEDVWSFDQKYGDNSDIPK
ncbi:MAG: hypothetical protein EXR35_06345 [Limnohabitans sp.]|nr:hypothetical protein [Limnohabitans sp.]